MKVRVVDLIATVVLNLVRKCYFTQDADNYMACREKPVSASEIHETNFLHNITVNKHFLSKCCIVCSSTILTTTRTITCALI